MNAAETRTIVILGATSAVAIAFARQACMRGPARFVLLGRDQVRLGELLADLTARGANPSSFEIAADIGDPGCVEDIAADILARTGRVDDVLLAYGVLGDQKAMQSNLGAVRSLLDVNLVSAAMWCEVFASHFEAHGKGRLAVLGSVAGDRGRQSNYHYGAGKAAIERICEGMAHRFGRSSRITITVVKPGFIDTPMTEHIKKGGALWATPERVADIVHRAMDRQRTKVYAPWFWRIILLAVRGLPVPLMHRTKL